MSARPWSTSRSTACRSQPSTPPSTGPSVRPTQPSAASTCRPTSTSALARTARPEAHWAPTIGNAGPAYIPTICGREQLNRSTPYAVIKVPQGGDNCNVNFDAFSFTSTGFATAFTADQVVGQDEYRYAALLLP